MNFLLTTHKRAHLLQKTTRFGASPQAEIRIHTTLTPLIHATIFTNNQIVRIIDHSGGRTFVNGFQIRDSILFPGDIIQIHKKIFKLEIAKTICIDLSEDNDVIDLTGNANNNDTAIEENSYDHTTDNNIEKWI